MTAQEAIQRRLVPMVLYDANGMEIKRAIVRFEQDTGEVESYILDSKGNSIVDRYSWSVKTRLGLGRQVI